MKPRHALRMGICLKQNNDGASFFMPIFQCTGTEPVPETPTEDEPPVTEEPKQSSNMGMIIAIVAIAGIGGAAYYYFKFIKGKKQKDDDMDFFDDEGYEEEPYINEDREPEIADDEETEGDD